MHCMKSFSKKSNLTKHTEKFQGKCAELMTDEEYQLLRPSWAGPWQVWCKGCEQDVAITYIKKHLHKHHEELAHVAKGWYVMKDHYAGKKGKPLDKWSTFQFQWDIKTTEVDRLAQAHGPEAPPAEAPPQIAPDQSPAAPSTEAPPQEADAHDSDATPTHDPVPEVHVSREEHPMPEDVAVPQVSVQAVQEFVGGGLEAVGAERHPNQALALVGDMVMQSETRIVQKVDSIVQSFNQVLKEGLGEVKAKYPVAISQWVTEFDPLVHGGRFPQDKLSTNYNIELFKTTMYEFRGLEPRTASYIVRDIHRFIGCFDFPDEAGEDLGHLLVSIFKAGFLRQLLTSKLWNSKAYFLKSLKQSLQHFVGFLENEERVHRAFGGLTTALGNILRALDWELKQPLKVKDLERKQKRAEKDAELIESWVGSDIWGEMVFKAMQVLTYIFEHRADDGFFTKDVHQLANQCLAVIIFLNSYPGRCGGWQLLEREKVLEQILEDPWGSIITHYNHKTKKYYGPILKWAPSSLQEAFLMYSSLPFRDSDYFIVSHTPTDIICCSHVLQCACRTFGHPGAVPNTNFVRKLFATVAGTGEDVDEASWAKAVDDLANIDAHSADMARSIHYDLRDKIKGGVIKKSMRAFFRTMKRMPLAFPELALDNEEFTYVLGHMGKRSFKRKMDDVSEDLDELGTQEDPKLKKRRLRTLMQTMAQQLKEEWEEEVVKPWMIRHIVDDLWYQGEEVTYLQARYAITGK